MTSALLRVFSLLCVVSAVGCSDPEVIETDLADVEADGKADRFEDAPELELLIEGSLENLIEHPDTSRFEASGVALAGDRILIVFDNLRGIASLDIDLDDSQWVGESGHYGLKNDSRVDDYRDFVGFEGITVDSRDGRATMAIEGLKTEDGDILPALVHLTTDDEHEIEWLDYEVAGPNKGVEGLAYLEVEDRRWLAAICESGKCDDANRGRLILRDEVTGELETVNLPKRLGFDDFSGLAIDGDRLAVVSQESSRVWIGTAWMNFDGELELETEQVLNLPRQRDGDIAYCNVEGLSWLDFDTLVAVSDVEKNGQPNRCDDHSEQIHFFSVP